MTSAAGSSRGVMTIQFALTEKDSLKQKPELEKAVTNLSNQMGWQTKIEKESLTVSLIKPKASTSKISQISQSVIGSENRTFFDDLELILINATEEQGLAICNAISNKYPLHKIEIDNVLKSVLIRRTIKDIGFNQLVMHFKDPDLDRRAKVALREAIKQSFDKQPYADKLNALKALHEAGDRSLDGIILKMVEVNDLNQVSGCLKYLLPEMKTQVISSTFKRIQEAFIKDKVGLLFGVKEFLVVHGKEGQYPVSNECKQWLENPKVSLEKKIELLKDLDKFLPKEEVEAEIAKVIALVLNSEGEKLSLINKLLKIEAVPKEELESHFKALLQSKLEEGYSLDLCRIINDNPDLVTKSDRERLNRQFVNKLTTLAPSQRAEFVKTYVALFKDQGLMKDCSLGEFLIPLITQSLESGIFVATELSKLLSIKEKSELAHLIEEKMNEKISNLSLNTATELKRIFVYYSYFIKGMDVNQLNALKSAIISKSLELSKGGKLSSPLFEMLLEVVNTEGSEETDPKVISDFKQLVISLGNKSSFLDSLKYLIINAKGNEESIEAIIQMVSALNIPQSLSLSERQPFAWFLHSSANKLTQSEIDKSTAANLQRIKEGQRDTSTDLGPFFKNQYPIGLVSKLRLFWVEFLPSDISDQFKGSEVKIPKGW